MDRYSSFYPDQLGFVVNASKTSTVAWAYEPTNTTWGSVPVPIYHYTIVVNIFPSDNVKQDTQPIFQRKLFHRVMTEPQDAAHTSDAISLLAKVRLMDTACIQKDSFLGAPPVGQVTDLAK